jgi:hypothetical protein
VAVAQVLWPDFAVVVQAWWILDSSDLSVNRFVQFDRQIFQETFSWIATSPQSEVVFALEVLAFLVSIFALLETHVMMMMMSVFCLSR